MSRLDGKTALVTGASRGIGRAIALAMARDGARVLVHYGKSGKEAESVVSEIRKTGGNAVAVGAELSSPEGASELAAKVRALVGERLDVSLRTPESPKRLASKTTPLMISTASLPQMFALRSFCCSSFSRSSARAPA